MRRVLWLLTCIALLAVILVGFLVMRKGGNGVLITHNFQRIIPNSPSTNTPYSAGQPSDVRLAPTDPDDDLAQAPVAPPPVTTPPAPPSTVQTSKPAYTPPNVDTIDASSPPSAPPTPIAVPQQEKTTPKASSDADTNTSMNPKTTQATEPKASDKTSDTKTNDSKTSDKAAPDTSSTFDSHGIFTLQKDMHKNGYHDNMPAVIVVDKGAHFTYVVQNQDGKVVIVYRASNAVGKADTPSPPGPYKVADIQAYPTWTPPKSIKKDQTPVKPYNVDSHNPLGVEILRLNKFGVALHGTNDPRSIRSDASHGCVRHSNEDIKKIASMARVGTTVIITDKFAGTKISKKMFGSR